MTKNCLFFDMDGVILDSMKFHAQAWIHAFRELGLEFTEEEIYLHEGAIELDTALGLFTSRGITPTRDFFEKAYKLQKQIFKERFAQFVRPFPEVPDLLQALKKDGKRLALVTSSSEEIFSVVFPHTLQEFFDVIITGDKVQKRKPHPDPYLKAKELLKATQEETAVVENAPAGILSAKRANLYCIAITTTLGEEHLSLADLIVKNHQDLKNILLNGTSNQAL